jgi:2-polyprenyl-3-methyl-5-hydroxy-6-metoxy-1,4-benzoquinol methylase
MIISAHDSSPDFGDISDSGERVTHLYPNDCYYAHLSIYRFASKYSQDKLVLDAGSGAGYGTAYFADEGARFVWGIDVSSKAVAFSLYHFQRPNLRFQVMDLQEISGFPNHYFDLIFSSNTLEHVPDVSLFLQRGWELLKPEGVMIVAVPPIIDEETRALNVANLYHLNIWSPRQWHHVLRQFFSEIECYMHHFEKPGITLDFGNTPEQTIVNEEDFLFLPISLERLSEIGTITAMFVARNPRPKDELPSPGSGISFVDDSFTRSPPSPVHVADSSNKHRHLLRIAWNLVRHYGLLALMREAYQFCLRRLK